MTAMTRDLVQVGRGAGWGLTRDSTRLHLAIRLRTALGGGLSNAEALGAIIDEPRGLRPLLGGVRFLLEPAVEAAEDGAPLSEALASAKAIDPWERRLLEAGERTGRLDDSLDAWIEALRVRACALRTLPQMLVYPLTVLGVAVFVILGLTLNVQPHLANMLSSSSIELPPLTEWVLSTSGPSVKIAALLFALLCLLGCVVWIAQRNQGGLGRACSRLLDRLLFFGPARAALVRSIGLEVLAAGLSAGDSETVAMQGAAEAQKGESGRRAWLAVSAAAAVGEALPASHLLSARFLRSVETALATEEPSARLRSLSRRELASWWRRSESVAAYLEPLLILGLGLFLALQVVGWWLLIFSVNSVVLA